jgi:hypothetical protein
MASSSRPFQSQTVSRLVAGYRQLKQGAARLWRQGCTAVVWGVQAAAYPVYRALQVVKMAHRQLQASRPGATRWPALQTRLPGCLGGGTPATDTPILALLSAIQPNSGGGLAVRRSLRQFLSRPGALLRRSRAGAVLSRGQWHLVAQGQADSRELCRPSIQGVASDLATRNLVLVTLGNQIVDSLTADQRDRLQRAIALLLRAYTADYAQLGHRGFTLGPQGAALSRSQTASVRWSPLGWLRQAIAWMQTQPRVWITYGLSGAKGLARLCLASGEQGFVRLGAALPADRPRFLFPGDRRWPQPSSIRQPLPTVPVPPALESNGSLGAIASGGAAAMAAQPRLSLSLSLETGDLGTIEVDVTGVNYIDHPLVWVLRWIDRGLSWLEARLYRLWQWLRSWG